MIKAGGLAGIIYGVGWKKGIPQNWIKRIAKIEWLKDLCVSFEESLQRKNIG